MSIYNRIMYNNTIAKITSFYRYWLKVKKNKFGYFSKTSRVRYPIRIRGIENVYMYEHTHILGNANITAIGAKFIVKKNSGAAEGLTVFTENHKIELGEWFIEKGSGNTFIEAKDVIIEEDVWIGANVTLLMGVTVGRGSIVGAGSVCRKSIPPYSIVMGNPAKVVGFKFTPEEVVKHENVLYPEEDRLSIDFLEKNYNKYFLNQINEIKQFLK